MRVGELGAVWLRLGLTGAMRSRGPKPRYSPSAQDQRPQLGGELGPDLLQRQVDKVAATPRRECKRQWSKTYGNYPLTHRWNVDQVPLAFILGMPKSIEFFHLHASFQLTAHDREWVEIHVIMPFLMLA